MSNTMGGDRSHGCFMYNISAQLRNANSTEVGIVTFTQILMIADFFSV